MLNLNTVALKDIRAGSQSCTEELRICCQSRTVAPKNRKLKLNTVASKDTRTECPN